MARVYATLCCKMRTPVILFTFQMPNPSARGEPTVEMMQRLSAPSDEESQMKEAWTSDTGGESSEVLAAPTCRAAAASFRGRAAAAPRRRRGSDDNVDGSDSEGDEVKVSPQATVRHAAAPWKFGWGVTGHWLCV